MAQHHHLIDQGTDLSRLHDRIFGHWNELKRGCISVLFRILRASMEPFAKTEKSLVAHVLQWLKMPGMQRAIWKLEGRVGTNQWDCGQLWCSFGFGNMKQWNVTESSQSQSHDLPSLCNCICGQGWNQSAARSAAMKSAKKENTPERLSKHRKVCDLERFTSENQRVF